MSLISSGCQLQYHYKLIVCLIFVLQSYKVKIVRVFWKKKRFALFCNWCPFVLKFTFFCAFCHKNHGFIHWCIAINYPCLFQSQSCGYNCGKLNGMMNDGKIWLITYANFLRDICVFSQTSDSFLFFAVKSATAVY